MTDRGDVTILSICKYSKRQDTVIEYACNHPLISYKSQK